MGCGARERTCGGSAVSGLLAWGLSCRDRGGRSVAGGRAARGSQAYLGPRALCRARDMMIDWAVLPPAGDAAAESIKAVRLALRGRTGSG